MTEETPDEKVEVVPTPTKAKPKISGGQVLGRLFGAGLAIPVAAVTFCVAGLAGVPAVTALSRSIVAALAMWILVAFGVRIFVGIVARDWKTKAKNPKSEQQEIKA